MKKNDDRDKYQDVQKQNQNVFPKVDRDLCIGCGSCIDMCPRQAITLEEDKAFIHEDQCANCRACVTLCPVGAIN
jgi:ferredoxin